MPIHRRMALASPSPTHSPARRPCTRRRRHTSSAGLTCPALDDRVSKSDMVLGAEVVGEEPRKDEQEPHTHEHAWHVGEDQRRHLQRRRDGEGGAGARRRISRAKEGLRTTGRVLFVHVLFFGLILRSAQPLTVSTWNLLAPCHKNAPSTWDPASTPLPSPRESEDEALWRPRTDALLDIVRTQLATSDIIW